MGRIWGYLGVTAVLAVGMVCSLLYIRSPDTPAPSVWSGGEIRVGYSSEPPYSFRTPEGNVTGVGPEIAKAVLGRMGVERIRWVLLDFGKAISALEAGQIDLLANGLFTTPGRAARVLFSLPYCAVGQGLLVRTGNPRQLHAYEDVAAASDVVAAVLDGSVEQQALMGLGLTPERLFVVPDPASGLAAVRAGRADCLALSGPTVHWLAGESAGEAEPAVPLHQPAAIPMGQSAYAMRQSDGRLAAAVDAVLREYIGSPDHLARATPLGFGPDTLPQWSRAR